MRVRFGLAKNTRLFDW